MLKGNKNDGGMVSFKCVVVNGTDRDYAIYYGPSDWTTDQIAAEGTKFLKTTGERLVYDIPELAYQFYSRVWRA